MEVPGRKPGCGTDLLKKAVRPRAQFEAGDVWKKWWFADTVSVTNRGGDRCMGTNDIPEQLRRFEIPGRVTLQEGNGELTKIGVVTDWSTAEIYLHGAQVTGFQKRDEPPLLFLSQCSRFDRGQPIRGGVPLIFPWFGAREGEPSHGFARLTEWTLHESVALPEGGVTLRFSLPEIAESAFWSSFMANYIVTVTDCLTLELMVTNTTPEQEFTFENCLHTYFEVGDIGGVSITGLKGAAYLDQVDNFAQKTEAAEAIRITSEVDRIYLDTTSVVEIHDARRARKVRIEKSGSASTVVWNPWIAKGQQMPDFGNDEYKRMVCVESGNVARNRLALPSGKSTALRVKLSSAPLK
jgi:glucose-6-phosphate 1-epimerase